MAVSVSLWRIAKDTPKGPCIVPIRVTWDGRYLGQIIEARVEVF